MEIDCILLRILRLCRKKLQETIFNLQKCLWNIIKNDDFNTIYIFLTPEDLGDFENRTLVLQIGYGYKDDYPGSNDETELASFEYPVTENATVKVTCDDAWVSMLARKSQRPFRISYVMAKEGMFLLGFFIVSL